MAESTIITGQFVRISQTPASIGERFLALVIDYFLIVLYVYATAALFNGVAFYHPGVSGYLSSVHHLFANTWIFIFCVRHSIMDKASGKN